MEVKIMQNEKIDVGTLQVRVTSAFGSRPVENAKIQVGYSGEADNILEQLRTDGSGKTDSIAVDTPPLEYSLEPDRPQPYSEMTLKVEAEGYETVNISGVEILPTVEALQDIRMFPQNTGEGEEILSIPPHTLYYPYPPKIAESEIKKIGEPGEIVLSRVVVPEYVVVHDGVPDDRFAKNY